MKEIIVANLKLVKDFLGVYEEIYIVRECLLSFGVESFVFQFAVQKFRDQDTQNYNFACCFERV